MLLVSAPWRSLHRMAGVAMVLGTVIGAGGPAAGHAAIPPPPAPTRSPLPSSAPLSSAQLSSAQLSSSPQSSAQLSSAPPVSSPQSSAQLSSSPQTWDPQPSAPQTSDPQPPSPQTSDPQPPSAQTSDPLPPSAQTSVPAPPAPLSPPDPPTAWAGPAPVITLGFDDGTADHLGVAEILGQQNLRGVFYVNSGRLGNPSYLTLDQVRQIQRDGHEIGGHTVFHLDLSQQDSAEQKRAICVDRNQLLAAGIQATSFAYPFRDPGAATSLAPACGYRSARTLDGIGCPGCPDAESIRAGDPFGSRALSGFGPQTTADDLKQAVRRTTGPDGWLQMVFHRICTTSCDGNSVRAGEFTAFISWLAAQRDTGVVRTATVRQVLDAPVLPGVAAPRATAATTAFRNNSFEQPGTAAGAPPRCFTYGGPGATDGATWSRVADSRRGQAALRAVITPASAGSRLVTSPDLGSCAPPIRAGAHYRVGFWYKATQPIKATTYARRPLGGYRAFGPAMSFPASPAWSLASWTVGPVPDGSDPALSLSVSLGARGIYTFDDFAISGVADHLAQRTQAVVRAGREPTARPASRPRARPAARPAARPGAGLGPSRTPATAFVPPDLDPQLPAADRQVAGNDLTGPPAWRGYGEIAGAILLAFAAVVFLDRRFRQLHRRTRFKVPRERRSGLLS